MGLVGLLITAVIIILVFAFYYLSSSSSTLTPEKTKAIQTNAQDVMDSTTGKAKSEQEQIKNIDLP